MGRPDKNAVDYFPHVCHHGKTMFVLEERYGNDGYAFWFKLLEMLGEADGHYLDGRDPGAWEYLQARTRQSEAGCREILELLAKLGALDPELWRERQIIWSQNFVNNLSYVYRKRKLIPPARPSFCAGKASTEEFTAQKSEHRGVYGAETPQSKVKESKKDTHKRKKCVCGEEKFSEGKAGEEKNLRPDDFEEFIQAYPRQQAKEKAKRAWVELARAGKLPEQPVIMGALAEQMESEQWQGRRVIPNPETWLRELRWQDKLTGKSREPPDLLDRCEVHPERPYVMKVGNRRLCRECKEEMFGEDQGKTLPGNRGRHPGGQGQAGNVVAQVGHPLAAAGRG